MSSRDPGPLRVDTLFAELAPMLAAGSIEAAVASAAGAIARAARAERCGVVLVEGGSVTTEGWWLPEGDGNDAWRHAARLASLAWPSPMPAQDDRVLSFQVDERTLGVVVLNGREISETVPEDATLAPILRVTGLRLEGMLASRSAEAARTQYERWFRTLDEQVRVLDRERQKFAAMVQQSEARVFVADAECRIRWTNASMRQSPVPGGGDWIGQSCRAACAELGDATRDGCSECPVERAFTRNRITHREFHREDEHGTNHHYLSALPIRGADGQPQEVMVTLQNLRDLGSLRRSEARYRMLFERSNKAILLIDPASGRVLQANPMAARMTGFEIANLTGQHLSDLHAPEEWARLEPHYAAALRARVMEPRECRIRARDGSERIAMVAGARYELGEQDVLMIDLQDVTERRRVEEALRRAEASLRTVISHAPIVLFTLDADGTFTMSEGRGLASLGLQPGQVVGCSVFDLYEGYPDVLDLIRRALAGEEFTASSNVGGRAFETHYSPTRDSEGHVSGVNGVAIDVTDRRRLEEQLVHAQKMEAIGRLAGGVAHDFNNLLAAILGHCELMLAELSPDDDLRSGIEEIHSAGGRGAQLTRQLLAFSRRDTPAPECLDLRAVVTELDALLRRLIGEDIALETQLADRPCVVRADRGQLEQTILNLVVNARDALPEGGRILVTVREVEPGSIEPAVAPPEDARGHVRLTVEDNGTGMDEAILAHVFEPFYTTKEQGKGTGLGLSTVYGIAERNHGWVQVASEKGRGSVFEVFLPRFDATPRLERPSDLETVRGGCETILLVEDEPAVRNLVRESLARHGYRVLAAEDGESALETAAGHDGPIALMLTDVVMPRMGGGEVARRIREQRPDLRVIFMSGYTDDAVVRHGVLEARVAFLQKPFRLEDLARKVREVMDAPLAAPDPADEGRQAA